MRREEPGRIQIRFPREKGVTSKHLQGRWQRTPGQPLPILPTFPRRPGRRPEFGRSEELGDKQAADWRLQHSR